MEYTSGLPEDPPNWVDVDIEKVCRVCLQPEEELFLIFDELNSYNKISLGQMITECSSCKVERHDDYPHQICLQCVEVLKIAYNFRLKCKESHQIAKLALNNGKEPRIPIIDNDNLPPLDKFTQTEALSFFPCEKCDKKFVTIEKLRTHRYYNHKGTCHDCRVCNKSFSRIIYLKNHLALYHPELGYTNNNECGICLKKFGRTEHLRRHQIKVHNQDLYKKKSKELIIESSLNNDSVKKYICLLCSIDCKTANDLKKHSCSENIVPLPINEETKSDINEDNQFDNDALNIYNSDDETDDEDSQPLSKLKKGMESEKKTIELEKKAIECQIKAIECEEKAIECKTKEIDCEKQEIEYAKKDDLNSTVQKLDEKPDKMKKESRKKIKIEHRCNMCQKMFTRADHLRRHERSHLNIKPYSCIHCNKTFTRSDHLNNHNTTFHSEKQPFICGKCNKGFARKDNLLRHQIRCENDQQQIPKVKKPKSYICEICQKGFTTERHYQVHVSNHNTKAFSCKFCKIVHQTKEESVEHLKTHDNQKPYLCSECGLRFVRNDYLVIHMRRHNGEKPYKCKFCDKGFPRATDLTVHERYHTGEKTHLCVTCGKGFHRGYNLLVHMRVHTGERPYKCSHCSKSFAQGNDLKAHIRRHTGERFRCEICDEGFIQGYHLTQHKKSAHGIDQPSHIRRLEKIKPVRTEKITQIEELMNEIDENDIKEESSNEITNISSPIFFTTTNLCSTPEVKYESDFD